MLVNGTENRADWWRQAAVYQIYPRSFHDANGDGLGDIAGITARVPYLERLGIDAVWLSPFYPSALADGGYDVDNYRDVDPKLGTLADFDEMSESLHAAGIKLIVDIVPNHSGDGHVWFQEALSSPPGSAARDRYLFRDGLGETGELPPSDWVSHFGGPAWTRVIEADGSPGQWYCHLFAREQPDWNWDNQEVRDDFLKTLRFWSDRGADGFRVDVAHALAKDMTEPLRSRPSVDGDLIPLDGSDPLFDRDDVHEIYVEWRRVFNEYDPPRMAVAEAWVPAVRRPAYASTEGLGQAFNFDLLRSYWNIREFKSIISTNLEEAEASGASSTWVFQNHDVIRHTSRYGLPQDHEVHQEWLLNDGEEPVEDREIGLRRARAATLLMLALPGSAYIYQGEELGLPEVADIPAADLQDPIWERTNNEVKGRDGCRVPIPWTTEAPAFGFSSSHSHLPQPAWFRDFAASVEDGVEGSTLEFYRAALAQRAALQTAESLEWKQSASPTSLHFTRPGGWHSVTNFGTAPIELPRGTVVVTSGPLDGGLLPSDTTAWIVEQENHAE